MIRDDDKQFMKSVLWTYSPGLSGVVYLLWRYVYYEQFLKDHPHPDRFMIPFTDVFFRCILCSTPDQAFALSIFRILNFHASKLWKNAPIKIRSELADSRLMMQAYINQLKLGIQPIDDDETPLPMADIPDMLYFLYRHFLPGCQEMIPELLGITIQRCWVAFLNPFKITAFLVEFRGMLGWFRAFIGCFDQPHPDNENLKLKAVTHTMDSDLMGLIGRVMVFINPTPKAPEDLDNNEKLLKECENIFIEISYLPPGGELEDYFVDRGVGARIQKSLGGWNTLVIFVKHAFIAGLHVFKRTGSRERLEDREGPTEVVAMLRVEHPVHNYMRFFNAF
ncbi:unnamed protein product [Rhizoctonia solani]|uniref:Uncharacterized protein n=1 Tax=Rhizoctonia solani TaxID=456999 RepID=A0A8H3DPM8_9AGAM|nr:unnamed protein product [Rhizoctonia solani]